MNMNKKLSLMALTLTAVLSLSACSDEKAEEAGEKIDNAITSTKDAAKSASEKTKDFAKETSQKVKDAAKDAKEKVKDLATDTGNAIEDACEKTKEKLDAKDTDC